MAYLHALEPAVLHRNLKSQNLLIDESGRVKARGVRVLLPYNPWDTGTRREAIWRHPGDDSDARTFAALLSQTGGDGFNGDTMGYVGEEFWQAAVAER